MKINIYVLIDPITSKIRYIGRTKNELKIRLRGHLSKSKLKKNHKDCWIQSLLKKNMKPKIKLVTIIVGWEESHVYERNLIKKAIDFGFNLVNLDDRGQGLVNKIITEEQKLKISNTLKAGYKSGNIKYTNTCPVIVYDLLGNVIYNFSTQKKCAEYLKIHVSTIETQVSGKVKRCGEYQIRSAVQENPGPYILKRNNSFNFKKVHSFNLTTKEIKTFSSFKEAATYFNVSSPTIKRKLESGKDINNKYILSLNVKKFCELLEKPEIRSISSQAL